MAMAVVAGTYAGMKPTENKVYNSRIRQPTGYLFYYNYKIKNEFEIYYEDGR